MSVTVSLRGPQPQAPPDTRPEDRSSPYLLPLLTFGRRKPPQSQSRTSARKSRRRHGTLDPWETNRTCCTSSGTDQPPLLGRVPPHRLRPRSRGLWSWRHCFLRRLDIRVTGPPLRLEGTNRCQSSPCPSDPPGPSRRFGYRDNSGDVPTKTSRYLRSQSSHPGLSGPRRPLSPPVSPLLLPTLSLLLS